MAPQRRRELAERLLRSEVAPRHVRRLTRELRDHYEDVVRTELARGLPPAAAGRIASERLGTDDRLAQSALAQPELRSTTARRPGLVLGAGPTLLWLGTVMATLAAIRVLPQTGVQASPPTWALL